MTEELTLRSVATGFDFPTTVAIDGGGAVLVVESGLAFAGAKPGGRVWRVDESGARELLAEGLRAPVNGAVAHGGAIYLSEAGSTASRRRRGG